MNKNILKEKIEYYELSKNDLKQIYKKCDKQLFSTDWIEFLFDKSDISTEFSQMFLDGSISKQEENIVSKFNDEQKLEYILKNGYLFDLDNGATLFVWNVNKKDN